MTRGFVFFCPASILGRGNQSNICSHRGVATRPASRRSKTRCIPTSYFSKHDACGHPLWLCSCASGHPPAITVDEKKIAFLQEITKNPAVSFSLLSAKPLSVFPGPLTPLVLFSVVDVGQMVVKWELAPYKPLRPLYPSNMVCGTTPDQPRILAHMLFLGQPEPTLRRHTLFMVL